MILPFVNFLGKELDWGKRQWTQRQGTALKHGSPLSELCFCVLTKAEKQDVANVTRLPTLGSSRLTSVSTGAPSWSSVRQSQTSSTGLDQPCNTVQCCSLLPRETRTGSQRLRTREYHIDLSHTHTHTHREYHTHLLFGEVTYAWNTIRVERTGFLSGDATASDERVWETCDDIFYCHNYLGNPTGI